MAGRPESEREFGDWVIAFARLHGWLVHHGRPAQDRHGRWKTPIQGDTGFPDLVMASERRRMVVFAEVKSARGRTTPEQNRWLDALELGAEGRHVLVCLWRPSDRPEIEKLLSS